MTSRFASLTFPQTRQTSTPTLIQPVQPIQRQKPLLTPAPVLTPLSLPLDPQPNLILQQQTPLNIIEQKNVSFTQPLEANSIRLTPSKSSLELPPLSVSVTESILTTPLVQYPILPSIDLVSNKILPNVLQQPQQQTVTITESIPSSTVTLPAPTVTMPAVKITENTLPTPPPVQIVSISESTTAEGNHQIDINVTNVPQGAIMPEPTPVESCIRTPEKVMTCSRVSPEDVPITTSIDQEPIISRVNEKQSIENMLKSYLYTPLAKVIVKTENGKSGEFIKAINPTGIIVFVRLDDGGYVSIDKCDLTMVKKATTDMIPYSVKKCSLEMVTPHSSGVVIECKDGICVIERGDRGTPIETNYIYTEDASAHHEGNASIIERKGDAYLRDDTMMAHPIVSIKDIKANHILAVEYAERSNERLFRQSETECKAILDNFNTVFGSLSVEGKKFYKLHGMIEQHLNDKTCEQSIRQCAIKYNSCDASKVMYDTLKNDVKRRSEIQADTIKFCRVVASLTKSMNEIVEDFSHMNSKLEMDYREISSKHR